MKSLRRCVVVAGALAIATVCGAREAHAAGFANTRIGGEQGTVVSTNPTALYYNPGAMGLAHGSQLGMYGSLALRHATWDRPASPSDIQDPATQVGNTGKASTFNAFGGPTLAGTLQLGNFTIGGGFFAPFYGRAHWSKNDAFEGTSTPLARDGVQRWFVIDGALTVLYFTVGAAYRIGPFSIGVAGNLVSSTIDQTQAKNPSGLGLPDSTAEGRVFIDAHTFNGSFGAGAMLEPVPGQLWIGASYQARPQLIGPDSMSGIQKTTTYAAGSASPSDSTTYNINFSQKLPDIIRGGLRYHPKNVPLELRLFGDITRWSSMAYQCLYIQGYACAVNTDGSDASGGTQQFVRRNWNDSFGGRLGVSWWVAPAVELLLGAGYETAAVPDSTLAPDIADGTNISGALGVRLGLTESLFLSLQYTQLQYLDRNNVGKSTLAVDEKGNPRSVPTVEQDSGGLYTQWIGIMTGNLEALF
jgi:long-chain fatty acid transport protein